MTDAWEPANQLERQLGEALREGDQDTYFALVREAELFVPLPPGEADSVMANQSAFTWPTSTREGRTHVLAYTTAEAARACLGPTYQHFLRITLADMARSWPDQEWWLAVNSGLPIEGYLPAWFVAQLAAGGPTSAEAEPARDTTSVHASAPARDAAAPLPSHEGMPPVSSYNGLPPAPAQNGTTPTPGTGMPAMPDTGMPPVPDAVLPPAADTGPHPTIHDGFPPPPAEGMPAMPPAPEAIPPVPTGQPPAPPVHEGMAPVPDAPPDGMPPAPVADGVPAAPVPEAAPDPLTTARPGGPQAVGDSPITPHIAPGAEFTPLDEEEQGLYDAAARGDLDGFLRTLLGVRQIWVPMVEGGDVMLGPGRPGFQWYVEESGGRPAVPLFTGPGRMREAMGGHPFVLSDLAKVLRFWPDPTWELVINRGTSIGASIPGERITAISQQVDAEAAARLANDFPAQSDAERQMFDARGDHDMLVKVLLDTAVFLPVWSRTPPAVQTPPGDPSFPWSAVPVRGRPSILAFTSFDWMKAAVGTTGFVMPAFAELLAAWPQHDWSISVNPGTPIEVSLSGEQIRALVGASTGQPREQPARAPEPSRLQSVVPPSSGPPRLAAGAAPADPSLQSRQAVPPSQAQPLDAGMAPQHATDDAEGGETPPGPWTVMQKVVPHDQVSWYLDQAYDRVAGFVHRVQDVIDIGTPGRLYETLGLLRDGSPFSTDDTEVHIIRWPAYRAALYRAPFGGQSDEALRAWGDNGWVVETPPFAGDGFAPGSGGTIREYKVDSFRLPHGSEMYVIGNDGSERFVARFDADRVVWGNSE